MMLLLKFTCSNNPRLDHFEVMECVHATVCVCVNVRVLQFDCSSVGFHLVSLCCGVLFFEAPTVHLMNWA